MHYREVTIQPSYYDVTHHYIQWQERAVGQVGLNWHTS